MGENNTQSEFFQTLKSSIPGNISLVDEVAEALNISNDSAYRRMRGETPLSLDEFRILCNRFKVTPQFLNPTGEGAFFHYRYLEPTTQSFGLYLQSLMDDLQKVNGFEQKKIITVAKDIPIFHFFQFPLFCTFKMFFWMKSILSVRELADKKFTPSLIDNSLIDLAGKMAELYIKIPAVEIWTDETVHTAVRQVEYYWESGFLEKKEDGLALCGQLREMISHIQKQAEAGAKFFYGLQPRQEPENFKLFYSDFIIANNTILVAAGNMRTVYLTHRTFNALVTRDTRFCTETENWIHNLEKTSYLLSGIAEKQRNRFFNDMLGKVEMLEKKINS
ncbi:MAG: hypothetical protein HYY40_09890 [Bacteroidetes bacterium]|nr:hypothetical protein [Bacteroidota bacterium]